MRKKGIVFYLEKISQGVLASLVILAVLFAFNKDTILAQLCLYETMPSYEIESSMKMLFKFSPDDGRNATESAYTGAQPGNFADESAEPVFKVEQIEKTDVTAEDDGLIGIHDVIFQPETDYTQPFQHFGKENFTIEDINDLRNVEHLKNKFYVVDKRTDVTPDLFNVDDFLSRNLTIDNTLSGPKVLVFHTHSNEKYTDSAGQNQGVVGFGEKLCQMLENKYGIETLHNTDSFDMIDGKSHVMGAYERMEPVIRQILKDNPSIQVAIDIHRDGVAETTRLVENIDGKPTAQIMFFNGLSKRYNDNGVLEDIAQLPNQNLKTNLALSFNAQLAANTLYPGLTRKVYLNAYRYSLHMLPKSMLIEVGAQTNTEAEALNAVEPLADILAHVLLE